MTSFSLEFERPDLSGWLAIALGLLLALEGVRLAVHARRERRDGRWTLLAAALVLVGGYLLWLFGPAGGSAADAAGAAGERGGNGSNTRHLLVLAGLAGIAVVWAQRAYARTTRAIAPRRLHVLIALRTAALLCLLVMVAGPVLQWTHQSRQRSAVVVLLDDSASMGVRDIAPADARAAPIGRIDAVKAALHRAGDAIAHAGLVVDLRWLQFADQLQEVRWPRPEAKGSSTALLDALAQVQTQFGSLPQPLSAVVIISDGRDNASAHTLAATGELFSSAGVPVYAVGVGSETPSGQTRSLIARRLDCPPVVSLLNAFPIHTEFYAAGLAGSDVEVTVLYDDQVVHRETLRPASGGEVLRLDTAYTPTAEGLHRVVAYARVRDLDAPALADPAGAALLSAFVQVINNQIRVAYIDRPRYERAAVARVLAGARDFQLVRMDVLPAAQRPEIDWRIYSAVILGDIDPGSLSRTELEELRRQVIDEGKGIALLGGVRTLGSGKLAGSPLADLLPVELGASGQIESQVPLVVTPAGQLHPILQTARALPGDDTGGVDSSQAAAVAVPGARSSAAPERFWASLPPLMGASRLTGLKPAAEVLLTSPQDEPLLVVQELGHGRSAVVAFDSTWRWALASDAGADAQKRFWRQLALWLTNRRPQVWVNVEKPRYLLNRLRSGAEQVIIRAGATSSTPGTNTDLRIEGTLRRMGSTTAPADGSGEAGALIPLTWRRAGEVFECRPPIDAPGEYRVHVRASDASGTLGEAQAAFIVASPDLEWIDPLADLATLRQLAEATSRQGGGYFPLERLTEVFDRLSTIAQPTTTTRIDRHRMVADHPWGWLSVFVGLIAAEWILRRRSGLL